jgi:hypothetical protein
MRSVSVDERILVGLGSYIPALREFVRNNKYESPVDELGSGSGTGSWWVQVRELVLHGAHEGGVYEDGGCGHLTG